jgi:hypothetical protein
MVRDTPHPHLLGLSADKLQFETESTRYVALPYLAGGELFRMVEAQGEQNRSCSNIILMLIRTMFASVAVITHVAYCSITTF